MTDAAKIKDFAQNISVDGRHEGDKVSAVGFFIVQQFQGVEKLAGSQYQFVIEDDLALVAAVPTSFVPKEGARYLVTGVLRGSGELGLFPGIEIDAIADA